MASRRRDIGGAYCVGDRTFPSLAMAVAFAIHHVEPGKSLYVRDALGARLGHAEIIDGVRQYTKRAA
mgnify:CR=1 FL=1